jgi:hypothetical protein
MDVQGVLQEHLGQCREDESGEDAKKSAGDHSLYDADVEVASLLGLQAQDEIEPESVNCCVKQLPSKIAVQVVIVRRPASSGESPQAKSQVRSYQAEWRAYLLSLWHHEGIFLQLVLALRIDGEWQTAVDKSLDPLLRNGPFVLQVEDLDVDGQHNGTPQERRRRNKLLALFIS